MILQITMDAIGISFFLADITHQPRSEEAAKETIQYQCFQKIRVMPVRKGLANRMDPCIPAGSFDILYFFSVARITGADAPGNGK
jgi:hypothetical protein